MVCLSVYITFKPLQLKGKGKGVIRTLPNIENGAFNENAKRSILNIWQGS